MPIRRVSLYSILYWALKRAQSWLAGQVNPGGLVVPIRVNNAVRYAVVSGPFDRAATLAIFKKGMGSGADYWVRTAGSLQISNEESNQVGDELFRNDGQNRSERAVVEDNRKTKAHENTTAQRSASILS